MKNKFEFSIVLFVLLLSCTKENINSVATGSTQSYVTSNGSDTVRIPLTDLGTGTYMGYKGGLYPGGANTPSGQYAADLQSFAASIVPLDSNGKQSSGGRIGFISIGASTCSIMMNNLREKTALNPATNPYLLMANCTGGGETIQEINDTISGTYWNTVKRKLSQNSLAAKQVEVVYMETDDSTTNMNFPFRANEVKTLYTTTLQILKQKFPNLRLVYVIGRTTTFLGPGHNARNREPGPYYNGWGCKQLIQAQINGNPSLAYKGPNAVVPLVTWGWYEWSVGGVPRQDGFLWTKDDTSDGLHANDMGADILSTNFMNFLLNDPFARLWYARN